MKSLEIMPLLEFTQEELQNKTLDDVRAVAELSSPSNYAKEQMFKESSFMDVDGNYYQPSPTDDEDASYLFPFND